MTHHHHAGHRHPAQPPRGPSLVRLSAPARLLLAAVAVAALWGALFAAMA